jgi:N-acetylmuramoyl-L-alanine amidase
MNLVISSGHGAKVSGASGVLNEVTEARKVCDRVGELLKGASVGCKVYHENTATTVNQNLTNIVNYHNSQTRDRDVSVHFNAYQTTSKPMGTECLYVSQQAWADRVAKAMAKSGGFINRGPKKRTDLYFLNNTAMPAVLLEVCFVDSSADADLYRTNFEAICRAIAESLAEITLPGKPTEPPVEPPVDPEIPPEVEFPTGENVVDIAITVKGDPTVTINDDVVTEGDPNNRVNITLDYSGDVMVTVDGEDFQVAPPPPSNRPTVMLGSQGPDVETVQQCLMASGEVDGDFGSRTENAVKEFQDEQSLANDGIVGPATWTKLEEVYSLPPYTPATFAPNHQNIICSVFGGNADPNDSAYPPYDFITDQEVSCALPWKWSGERPLVLVQNIANGRKTVCQIRDVGPWLIDDDKYVLGDARPVAEPKGSTIPRGKNQGKTSNGAGIDLTPAAAKAIGLSGMGTVSWTFVSDAVA